MSEVLLERDAGVARITLNRPDAGNAFNQRMAEALLAIALDVANDPEVRVVTLTGAGRMFCVGGDVGDIALATLGAHFTAAYGGIGLTPDGGMTWMLPRLVGMRQAQDIILTNRRVKADEAQALGLVTRIVDEGTLEAEGAALAADLATRAVAAMGQARWLIQTGMSEGFVAQMDRELQSIKAAGESAEGREGVQAFLERRKPDFQGENTDG